MVHRSRLAPVVIAACVAAATVHSAAPAHAAPDNPWLEERVLNMAHSGGEDEAPTNTMYAFKRAAKKGADMLELDVQSTKDGKLVVLHNATVDETTDGTGKVADQTWKRVKKYDAAYWFVRGEGTTHEAAENDYTWRGARNGDKLIPKRYVRKDFRIPLLREVFKEFPDTPINIEIKGTADTDTASYIRTGTLLASFLNRKKRTDVIVGSFNDEALADFHTKAPQIGMSAGRNAMVAYFLSRIPPPEGTVALQVPVKFSGIQVMSKSFVQQAQADGYAVHVWFSGSAPDDAATYNAMINMCVDGLMPSRPSLLERILDKRGIERPGKPGVDPCA